ncbi:hypothetical protein VNI00_009037 [Paramarasmius palmivorus]|uniref:Uncharacterized protein n=1 Tax=Paramarasmius palmivorus TaxID=297713 RepID=A0AAW0CUJ9_9AGAR
MAFSNLTDFNIGGKAVLQNIERDQYNDHSRTVINAQVVNVKTSVIQQQGDNNDEYKQFREIIRGDLYCEKELYRDTRNIGEWQEGRRNQFHWKQIFKARRTIQIQTSEISGNDHRPFTVISYHGEEAYEAWRQDFEKYSQDRRPYRLQLFGITRSKIPSLIFYDEEMMPFAQVLKTGMFWMEMYVSILAGQLECNPREVWIDWKKGRLCAGIEGPQFETTVIPWPRLSPIKITLEMLNEGIFGRYLREYGTQDMDRAALAIARHHSSLLVYYHEVLDLHDHWVNIMHIPEYEATPQPIPNDFLEILRFDTVYSASLEPIARLRKRYRTIWEWSHITECFGYRNGVILESGMTSVNFNIVNWKRESMNQQSECLSFLVPGVRFQPEHALTAHFHSILAARQHASDMSRIFLPTCSVRIELVPRNNNADGPGNSPSTSDPSDVYLVLPTPPASVDFWSFRSWYLTIAREYYWSSDEAGEKRIPYHECIRMGLPRLVPGPIRLSLRSWPKDAYDSIYQYQLARGFDPSTTRFAETLGLPIYDPVVPKVKKRLEELEHGPRKSYWWKASCDFDIPAFAI